MGVVATCPDSGRIKKFSATSKRNSMILLIEGSGRKDGNGAVLADLIGDTIPGVKRIRLHDLAFKDCNACGECRKELSICTLEDELRQYYPDFANADAIILVSPSYYGLPSGDMKMLIDRWYCMKLPKKNSRFKPGAKVLLFITQGSRRKIPSLLSLYWFKKVMNNHKCDFRGVILTDCSFDDRLGISSQKKKIMKALSFIMPQA